MRRKIVWFFILILFVFFFTGCTQQGVNEEKNTVSIENLSFKPNSLTISVGDTVTWKNNDGVTHTITSNNGEFDSGNIASGGSYEFTFSEIGTYDYHCTIHPSMKGQIIVQ